MTPELIGLLAGALFWTACLVLFAIAASRNAHRALRDDDAQAAGADEGAWGFHDDNAGAA